MRGEKREFRLPGNLHDPFFFNLHVLCYPFKHSVLILPVCVPSFACAEVCWSSGTVGNQWRFLSAHGLGDSSWLLCVLTLQSGTTPVTHPRFKSYLPLGLPSPSAKISFSGTLYLYDGLQFKFRAFFFLL